MPIAIIAVVVIGVIAVAGVVLNRSETVIEVTPDPVAATETMQVAETEVVAEVNTEEVMMDETETDVETMMDMGMSDTMYEDGSYEAVATYLTPRNEEHKVTVQLTIANDTVTETTVLYDDSAETKTPNHTRFNEAIGTEVTGVAVEDISLARVGGASLTTEAFNEALAEIKTSAQS